MGAQDFAKAMGDPAFRYGEAAVVGVAKAEGPWNRLSIAMTAVAAGAIVVAAVSLLPGRDVALSPVIRFTVPVGEGTELYLGDRIGTRSGRPAVTSLAFSPDGDLLVYSAWEVGPDGDELSRLYQRRLGQERADPMEGTEGGASPFFSPEGDWIGFFSAEGL